jgi:hypothetical protein
LGERMTMRMRMMKREWAVERLEWSMDEAPESGQEGLAGWQVRRTRIAILTCDQLILMYRL